MLSPIATLYNATEFWFTFLRDKGQLIKIVREILELIDCGFLKISVIFRLSFEIQLISSLYPVIDNKTNAQRD